MRAGLNLLNFANPFYVFYAIILVARAWQPTANYVAKALAAKLLPRLGDKQSATKITRTPAQLLESFSSLQMPV